YLNRKRALWCVPSSSMTVNLRPWPAQALVVLVSVRVVTRCRGLRPGRLLRRLRRERREAASSREGDGDVPPRHAPPHPAAFACRRCTTGRVGPSAVEPIGDGGGARGVSCLCVDEGGGRSV